MNGERERETNQGSESGVHCRRNRQQERRRFRRSNALPDDGFSGDADEEARF